MPALKTPATKSSTSKGFTIVELLLVIVVIAILATITISTYRGVQDKAKNASLETSIHHYKNALEEYAITHGKFPTPSDIEGQDRGGWWAICLGFEEDYPATERFSAGTCSVGNRALNLSYQGDVKTSTELQGILRETITAIPNVETLHDIRLSGYPIRGIIYTPWYSDGRSAQLDYALWGKGQKCAKGWANSGYFADGTRCSILMQAP